MPYSYRGASIEEQPLADVSEFSDADALAANQTSGRVEADGRSRKANRDHPVCVGRGG
jgi:hypothetical protein